MITFRERLVKPSAAIQAMIDGLKEMKGRDDVTINMGFFFHVQDSGCFACAATAAAMKVTGCDWGRAISGLSGRTDYLLWPAFAKVLGPDVGSADLGEFESAVNMFRIGYPGELFQYFDVPEPGLPADWVMSTNYWEEALPAVEAYRDKLIELGL